MRRWAFDVDEELSEGNHVALVATGPEGKIVRVWAEVEEPFGRDVVLRQFAIYGDDVEPGSLGLTALRQMARDAMEQFDVDSIRIEEARRTSGAFPGRAVSGLEFRRRSGSPVPDAEPQAE